MASQQPKSNLATQETDQSSESIPINEPYNIALPIVPSQMLASHHTSLVPDHIYSENDISFFTRETTQTAAMLPPASHVPAESPSQQGSGISFAATANELINQILNRTPSGGSVVDPESVIGESLRLYHGYKDGKYFLPNDAAEQDRLDLQHEMFRLLYDGWLSLVPFSKAPEYVLDVGTGTGLWAFEFAEQNPSSYVIGADLSAIQPTDRNVPNCTFIKSDIEDDWIFPQPNPDHRHCRGGESCEHNISFDYVHLRVLFSCFNDPRTVMRHAFRNMRSGGWIEFQEFDFRSYQANPNFTGNAMQRYFDLCTQGAANSGRNIRNLPKYKEWLEVIGFIDVTERKFLMPLNGWPSDPKMQLVGRYFQQDLLDGIHGGGYKMLKLAGLQTKDIETLISQCSAELRNPSNHSYSYSHVIYARKP